MLLMFMPGVHVAQLVKFAITGAHCASVWLTEQLLSTVVPGVWLHASISVTLIGTPE